MFTIINYLGTTVLPGFEIILRLLKPYLHWILPFLFISFFLATLIAFHFNQNTFIRRNYIRVLFVIIILVNITGFTVLPFTSWHKFSGKADKSQTIYEIRVVDADGKELHYDYRATLSVDGVSVSIMHEELADRRSLDEKINRTRWLLRRAIEYRKRIESRSLIHYLRFPPHHLRNIWTDRRINGYSEFIGIRVYRFEAITSKDGTEIISSSRTLVIEYSYQERNILKSEKISDRNSTLGLQNRRGETTPCS